MTKWVGVSILFVVAAFMVLLREVPSRLPHLRSEHSEPASSLPPRPVAVTPQGKQFHDPACKYIHGKPQMVSSSQAAEEGYTPDPRCMSEALRKHSATPASP